MEGLIRVFRLACLSQLQIANTGTLRTPIFSTSLGLPPPTGFACETAVGNKMSTNIPRATRSNPSITSCASLPNRARCQQSWIWQVKQILLQDGSCNRWLEGPRCSVNIRCLLSGFVKVIAIHVGHSVKPVFCRYYDFPKKNDKILTCFCSAIANTTVT